MMLRQATAAWCVAILLTISGCSPSPPALPDDSPTAVAQQITGSDGDGFLKEITNFDWRDDGGRAGELLAWVPSDANSADPAAAEQAGKTAFTIAEFLADNYDDVREAAETNPVLIEAYAVALKPYLGAMVGEPSGTAGFEPLDPLDSAMPRTVDVFALITGTGNSGFIEAASELASAYEDQFADYAAADPTLTTPDARYSALAAAARLRGLITAGTRKAGGQPDPTTMGAIYRLDYKLVSRLVHDSAPGIDPAYFNPDGSLKSADELDDSASWSHYNSQLGGHLLAYPELREATNEFRDVYETIARS